MTDELSPVIHRVMDCSTGNIRVHDMQLMDEHRQFTLRNPLRCVITDWGYLVQAITSDATDDYLPSLLEYGYSSEFVAVLQLAGDHNARYVFFDEDCDLIEGLPSFANSNDTVAGSAE